jgi:type I restriction enzyme S subunit
MASVGRAGLVSDHLSGALFNYHIMRLRLEPQAILPRLFIFYVRGAKRVQDYIREVNHGATRDGINTEQLLAMPVLLPPYREQERIVAEIEKHFTRLDAAVAALKRVQANLKRYRASVLKAACEGRLVPTEAELARAEGREYEPADRLLERILKERRAKWEADQLAKMRAEGKEPKDDKWKEKYPVPSLPNKGDLPQLPEGWVWTSISHLGFIASGQTPKGVDELAKESGDIPWLRVADMNRPGNERRIEIAGVNLFRKDAKSLGLHIHPAGTIIFPKRGGAIATNKKRVLSTDGAYDLNTMGIIPLVGVAEYIWWWFAGIRLDRLSDGSNVPQINHGDIEPLAVPLPPIAEQERIVGEVERRLSVVDEIETALRADLIRAERLRQAILKRAFEGSLVPQDPNDEPASVVLERIRAERASKEAETEPKKSARKKKARAADEPTTLFS